MLTLDEFLARIPKMELHLHLEGSIRPRTAVELAARNGVTLPPFKKVEELYHYDNLKDFLAIYTAVSDSVVSADDYRRITYEMLESCAAHNARYVEFFFSPQVHFPHGVSFDTQMDGILSGIADAEKDFGILSVCAPGINRELGPEAGEEFLDMILARRDEKLVGIGLDFNEAPFPPEPYAALFERARAAGLRVTAHAGETGPADFIRGSLDALKVRRIDHGYHVVNDPELMGRCRDEGILFTVCPSTSAITSPWHDLTSPDHAIRRMKESGLKVMLNSDDPPMFFTDLGEEYRKAAHFLGFSPADIRATVMNAIDGSWLDERTKKRWKGEWSLEIDALMADLQ
ncbi:adenosine deaminase [Rhizobium cremeum]|uniref:adenosine deaminase n=1 Tax=Rhizobium cremeum TaxID=2813827 RepID=UPI000DE30E2F